MNSIPVERIIERLHNDIERLENMVNHGWQVVWVPPEQIDQAIFNGKPLYTLVRKEDLGKCALCKK